MSAFQCSFGTGKIGHLPLTFKSKRNKMEDSVESDVKNPMFVRMLKARLKTDYNFYSLINNVEEFTNIWCYENALCSVVRNRLVLGLILS